MATRQRGSNTADSSKQRPPPPSIAETPFTADTHFIADPQQATAEQATAEIQQVPRQQRIAISAYLRAAQRGFVPGHELEDWLAAERELEADGASKGAFDRL